MPKPIHLFLSSQHIGVFLITIIISWRDFTRWSEKIRDLREHRKLVHYIEHASLSCINVKLVLKRWATVTVSAQHLPDNSTHYHLFKTTSFYLLANSLQPTRNNLDNLYRIFFDCMILNTVFMNVRYLFIMFISNYNSTMFTCGHCTDQTEKKENSTT